MVQSKKKSTTKSKIDTGAHKPVNNPFRPKQSAPLNVLPKSAAAAVTVRKRSVSKSASIKNPVRKQSVSKTISAKTPVRKQSITQTPVRKQSVSKPTAVSKVINSAKESAKESAANTIKVPPPRQLLPTVTPPKETVPSTKVTRTKSARFFDPTDSETLDIPYNPYDKSDVISTPNVKISHKLAPFIITGVKSDNTSSRVVSIGEDGLLGLGTTATISFKDGKYIVLANGSLSIALNKSTVTVLGTQLEIKKVKIESPKKMITITVAGPTFKNDILSAIGLLVYTTLGLSESMCVAVMWQRTPVNTVQFQYNPTTFYFPENVPLGGANLQIGNLVTLNAYTYIGKQVVPYQFVIPVGEYLAQLGKSRIENREINEKGNNLKESIQMKMNQIIEKATHSKVTPNAVMKMQEYKAELNVLLDELNLIAMNQLLKKEKLTIATTDIRVTRIQGEKEDLNLDAEFEKQLSEIQSELNSTLSFFKQQLNGLKQELFNSDNLIDTINTVYESLVQAIKTQDEKLDESVKNKISTAFANTIKIQTQRKDFALQMIQCFCERYSAGMAITSGPEGYHTECETTELQKVSPIGARYLQSVAKAVQSTESHGTSLTILIDQEIRFQKNYSDSQMNTSGVTENGVLNKDYRYSPVELDDTPIQSFLKTSICESAIITTSVLKATALPEITKVVGEITSWEISVSDLFAALRNPTGVNPEPTLRRFQENILVRLVNVASFHSSYKYKMNKSANVINPYFSNIFEDEFISSGSLSSEKVPNGILIQAGNSIALISSVTTLNTVPSNPQDTGASFSYPTQTTLDHLVEILQGMLGDKLVSFEIGQTTWNTDLIHIKQRESTNEKYPCLLSGSVRAVTQLKHFVNDMNILRQARFSGTSPSWATNKQKQYIKKEIGTPFSNVDLSITNLVKITGYSVDSMTSELNIINRYFTDEKYHTEPHLQTMFALMNMEMNGSESTQNMSLLGWFL